MLHDDETRTQADVDRLLTEVIAGDPSTFQAEYLRLLAEQKAFRTRIAALEAELKKTKPRAAKADELQKSATDLKRRLAESHAKLQAYKKESARLRKDLEHVRRSRSMQIGKAVLAPLHLVTGKRSKPKPTTELTATPTAPNKSPVATAGGTARFEGESELPLGQRSLETLETEFAMNPCATTLQRVLSRQWYQHGMVHSPAALVREHGDLVAEMEPRFSLLTERMLGEERLREGAVKVPPRGSGIAYLPEPGRAMYCVHSTPAFNSNGYSTRTRGVAEGMVAAGIDLRVVARAGYPWDEKVDVDKPAKKRTTKWVEGVPYIHVPGSPLTTTPIDRYLVEAADAFTLEALRQRPEVIQSASNCRTALPALIAARRVGVPFVYEVRGFWELSAAAAKPEFDGSEQYELLASLELLVASEADLVLAITRQVKEDLVRRGVPAERILVAPNAVNTDVFLPLPRDAAYAAAKRIRDDVPVIGFAGSMVGYEGLDLLLEASGLLVERGIDHQVVIAGSGGAAEGLKKRRDEKGLSSITFLGRLPQDEMPRLISTFDIMPMPRHSLAVTEMVSPLKPLEAFASMKAVVMSDVAPHRDLAGENQERALLFQAGSAESLADALQRLIENPDLRQDLGRAARLWTLDERRWGHIAQTMQQAHRRATELHRAASVDSPGVRLDQLQVGLVADEFTTKTLSGSLDVTPLDRQHWADQLRKQRFDAVIIESAWSGNGGQWHRGVGDYSDEEHRDIVELLTACHEAGIPTAFWNKEDPVHFARFRSTAALCDHVFTTDANMIPEYLATPGAVSVTASAMPFYAQPSIHNPLPSAMPYQPTIAYAGTYYGDRYKDRSVVLKSLLATAAPVGLTIYDRQAALPDSPYKFPPEFQKYSQGTLPYDQVIHSYKSHLAHLNVNSVTDSPSMYSRRVVEIAACGGVVLSGPGRGIHETFGPVIPATSDALRWKILLKAWALNPVERTAEAWRQMRAVYRSHTVDTAVTVMMRTMGMAVEAPTLDDYSLVLSGDVDAALMSVKAQSQPPVEVYVDDVDAARQALAGSTINVRAMDELGDTTVVWLGELTGPVARTHFEDLLTATRYGSWSRLDSAVATSESAGTPLAQPGRIEGSTTGLVRRDLVDGTVAEALRQAREGVTLLLAPTDPVTEATEVLDESSEAGEPGHKVVLVAGHDLKFAQGLIAELEAAGHEVLVDLWRDHSNHDEERSQELLTRADVVFCEWGLGNAVWYSNNVKEHQRLVVRVHSQELFRPYLRTINHSSVSRFVFVGPLIQQAAITSHTVPAKRTVVIPNQVDVEGLALPKIEGAEFNLGVVGIVPRGKRLDRAVDVLEELLRHDGRYRLFVKGKQPSDYPWMAARTDEMAWYDEVYARIAELNEKHPGAVTFDPHGDDMAEWYRKIGVALSTSDFESFHFTVADGAASGAVPASLEWPGADLLYPREWLAATPADLAGSIIERQSHKRTERGVVEEQYADHYVLKTLVAQVLGETI